MKVLILGAKGNLGSQLVKVFEPDNDILAWDREEIDIRASKDLHAKIIREAPQVIINCIAYNAVDDCEDEEGYEIAKALNQKAVADLADIALELGVQLIQYSSDYVFNGENKDGYREDDEAQPISRYGETKFLGEQEVLKRADKGLKFYLIRTSKLFGSKGESEVAKPSFFDIMLALSQEKEELDVVDEELSCFTYTFDLASKTKELIDNDVEHGIYHLVNSGACTWYEACRTLFDIKNIKTKLNAVPASKFPRPAKRPKYSVLLNTKLKPMRDYRDALSEYLNK